MEYGRGGKMGQNVMQRILLFGNDCIEIVRQGLFGMKYV